MTALKLCDVCKERPKQWVDCGTEYEIYCGCPIPLSISKSEIEHWVLEMMWDECH